MHHVLLSMCCYLYHHHCCDPPNHVLPSSYRYWVWLPTLQTLEENGVLDESPQFEDLGMPNGSYLPVLHVYWNDDLTVA